MNKKNRKIGVRIGIVALLASMVIYLENNFSQKHIPVITNELSSEDIMAVHFIDVGQGDSVLIDANGQFMLIDGGENNKGDLVVEYLRNQNVEKIDYVIATHPHSDHIGGLITVINQFPIQKIIMPDVIHTTRTFENFLDAIEENNLKITKPIVGDEYPLGPATFMIVAPNQATYRNHNDYSVVIKLTLGEHTFILTGDAEETSEREMVENGIHLSASVLKLGHHGSHTSSSNVFLDAINPSYAVISAGKDNKYGHPHKETLHKMADRKINVYRTDQHGTIVITTDGKTLTVSTEKLHEN